MTLILAVTQCIMKKIPALVFRDNVYGAQFHPEKSGQVGMDILKNFAKLVTT